jgi:hypothetical protein
MSSRPLHLILLSSLGLSLLIGNSAALAQVNSPNNGGVVVPTGTSGTSVPTGSSTDVPTLPTETVARFSCQYYNGQYTVMYQPQSQPGQYFPWAAPGALGGGWTPQKRCEAIASRLELYRPDGLQELGTAVENKENTICVTTEADATCRIVLTVPRGKDPYTVRDNVFQNLTTADSGQQTSAVNTYSNRGRGGVNDIYNLGRTILGGGNRTNATKARINLKPFLDAKDGGTATNLRNGVGIGRQTRPANRTILNPRIFR